MFVAFLCLGTARRASAEPSTQEKAVASRLFDEASKLMADGQAAAACPKYAESERIDPELGTLLHLGECYAALHKTASAWASFKEARDIAAQRNDPREPKIRERLAGLEQTLSNLVIAVADTEPAALQVQQDGAEVGRAGWNTPIPVDPGEHQIVALVPGAKPRRVSAIITDKPQTVTVKFPAIEYLPKEEMPAAPEPAGGAAPIGVSTDPRSDFAKHQRTVAIVVGSIGVVGLGVGSAFGLMAKSTYDKSDPHCLANHCDSPGHDFRQSALSKATVSDIAFGVGAAAIAGGVVLWLTAPKAEPSSAARVTPVIGPKIALISLERSF